MFKSYNFWVRLVAVVLLLARVIGAEFGFSIDSGLIMDIATIVASILVVLGVIKAPVVSAGEPTEDNKNNIGGNFMKTMEQVQSDIHFAKLKLIEKFGEVESQEITSLLDMIFEPEVEETVKPDEEEVVVTTEVLTETPHLETIEIVVDNRSEAPVEVKMEEPAHEEETVVEQNEDDALKSALRAKIIDLVSANIDQIISEITI